MALVPRVAQIARLEEAIMAALPKDVLGEVASFLLPKHPSEDVTDEQADWLMEPCMDEFEWYLYWCPDNNRYWWFQHGTERAFFLGDPHWKSRTLRGMTRWTCVVYPELWFWAGIDGMSIN
jgi:hypothetical protein